MRAQGDFGIFDPRFFGIQISVDSPEARNYLGRAYSGKPLRYDRNDNLMSQKLLLSTTAEHEGRHFHDALISPYSSKLLRLRRNIIINFDQSFIPLVTNLALTGANCIPVPLQDWLERDAPSRKAFLDQMNECGFSPRVLTAPPLPIIPNLIENPIELNDLLAPLDFDTFPLPPIADDLLGEWDASIPKPFSNDDDVRRIAIIKDHYDQIDFLLKGSGSKFGFDVQPWEIFEMTAILTQAAAAIKTFQGIDIFDFFKTLIETNPTYLRLINQFLPAKEEKAGQLVRTLGMIGFWCISTHRVDGKFYKDWSGSDFQSCPVVRFFRAKDYINKFGLPKLETSARSFFNALDEFAGFSNWFQNLELNADFNILSVERARLSLTGEPHPRMIRTLNAFEDFVEQQVDVLQRLPDFLEEYVDPGKYVSILDHLPKPPILLKLGAHAVLPEDAWGDPDVEQPGLVIVHKQTDEAGVRWISDVVVSDNQPREKILNILEFYFECRKIDFMFCKHHRSEPEGIELARWVPKNHLSFVELFD